jgi:flagellar FliJ protein
MTRQRAKRIQPLIQIAKNAVQEAMSYMGQLQQSIDAEKQKKETLIDYQSEYQNNFKAKGLNGVKGLEIQQFESFMLQINDAMEKQSSQVHHLQQQLDRAKNIYLDLNQRLKSYEKLQMRLVNQAVKVENNQMQKMLDEIGSQLHRLRQTDDQ